MVLAQQAGQLRAGRNPLTHLRTDFWHDQLGYLAIAANVANGHFDLTEPVTMTGVSHYPRLYYSIVGFVARVLGIPTVTSWNLLSFVLQFAAAFAVGLVAASLSRRWWVGLLAPLPFFTGVFAYLSTPGAWYDILAAHAVLWGPFGVLFSNNAETAGLCVGIIAVSAIIWSWSRPVSRATRITVTIVAAAAVGALSSFQTYSFLGTTYLLCFGAAAAGIVTARRKAPLLWTSLGLIVVVFLVGPLLAARLGQLPTLLFGLLPALPGLVAAILRSRGVVAWAGVAAVATAIPQVAYTFIGMLQGDAFLTYRVASNHDLGVTSWQALTGAAVVLIALGVALVFALRTRDAVATSVSAGALTAYPLLALNDVWGANAEPYRFWIEGILLGGVLAMLALSRLAGRVLPPRSAADTADPDTVAPDPADPDAPEADAPAEPADADAPAEPADADALAEPAAPRRALIWSLIVVTALWAASLPDWVNSLRDPALQAAWDPQTEREQAIESLAREAGIRSEDGLLTTELCIDNRTAKVISGAPVANYHMGMAWPADRDDIDDIVEARAVQELDFDAMERSDTVWVLTDSNCESAWEVAYADDLERVDSVDYTLADGEVIHRGSQGPGTITLWRVPDTR